MSVCYKAQSPSTVPQLTVQLLPGVTAITAPAPCTAHSHGGAKQLSPAAQPSSSVWHRRHVLTGFVNDLHLSPLQNQHGTKRRAILECMIHCFLTHNNFKNIEVHTGLKQMACSVFVLSKKSPHDTNQWDSNGGVLLNRNQDENVLISAHLYFFCLSVTHPQKHSATLLKERVLLGANSPRLWPSTTWSPGQHRLISCRKWHQGTSACVTSMWLLLHVAVREYETLFLQSQKQWEEQEMRDTGSEKSLSLGAY